MPPIPRYLPLYLGSLFRLGVLVQVAPSGDALRLGAVGVLVAVQAWLAGVMIERWRSRWHH